MDDPKARAELAHWLAASWRYEQSWDGLADRLLHSVMWSVRPSQDTIESDRRPFPSRPARVDELGMDLLGVIAIIVFVLALLVLTGVLVFSCAVLAVVTMLFALVVGLSGLRGRRVA